MRSLRILLTTVLLFFIVAAQAGNITVDIKDHSGNMLTAAKFKIFKGPNYIGEYTSGTSVLLQDGHTYKIFAHYKCSSTDRLNYTVNGNATLTFQTTLVTLHFGGGYLNYRGCGAWKSFSRPSMELFPNDFYGNTMKFQFGDVWNNKRYVYKTLNYKGKTSITKTVAVLQLLDHNGNPMAGGTATGGTNTPTTWHVSGSTNTQGLLMDMRDGIHNSLVYKMKYNNGNQVIGPKNPGNSPYYTFQTELVTLRLQKCDGTPLNGGHPRYGPGSSYWTSHWPNPNTGWSAPGETSAELFQGTYSFDMQYQGTSDQKMNITVPDNGIKLVWNTSVVTLNYPGSISYGGSTGDSRWFNKPSMNLLPGTYMFHFRGAGRTNIVIAGCHTAGTPIFVQLQDSYGNGLKGASFKYRFGWGSYTMIGTDNTGFGLVYFLPGTPTKTKVRVIYKGASIEKQQNVQNNPIFIFNTVKVTASLNKPAAAKCTSTLPADKWKYRHGWGGYMAFNNSGEEVLPVKTKVRVYYKGASLEKEQNVGSNAHFNFYTKQVTAKLNNSGGTKINTGVNFKYRYGWGSYSTFNSPEFMLPVKTKMRVYYKNASYEKEQNVATNEHFVFNTVSATGILNNHDNSSTLPASNWQYRHGWGSYMGFTNTGVEILPVKTKVRVYYAGSSVEKEQNLAVNPSFTFNTSKVTVQCPSCGSTPTYDYRYGWGTWYNLGTNYTVNKELLPVKTKFRISGPFSGEQQVNVSTPTQLVTFTPPSKSATTSFKNNKYSQNVSVYPNPVTGNNQLNIVYTLENQSHVSLSVYNSIGAQIAEISEGTQSSGQHSIEYNTDHLASGTYYLRFTYGDQNTVKPFIIK